MSGFILSSDRHLLSKEIQNAPEMVRLTDNEYLMVNKAQKQLFNTQYSPPVGTCL